MKISMLAVSLFADVQACKMSVADLSKFCQEAKLDGMDLGMGCIMGHAPTYIGQLKEEIAAGNMNLIMVTTYPDFTHPDKLQRDREEIYFAHDIAVASELGAKYVRILAGQKHEGTSRADGIKWAVESFKRMDDVAQKYGITLVYEDHSKPGAWYDFDFSWPTDIFLEIYEKTNDTNIRINFDTMNPVFYGDDPLPILKQVYPRLETIHANDVGAVGKFVPCLLGEGVVDFDGIFGFLKEKGWDNWICIEEISGTGPSAIKKTRDFVRNKWDSITV